MCCSALMCGVQRGAKVRTCRIAAMSTQQRLTGDQGGMVCRWARPGVTPVVEGKLSKQ